MPCYNCSTEFGILKRETGCELCGFSFCSKCCKKRDVSQECSKSKKLICVKCYQNLSGDKSSSINDSRNISPPAAHKKRVEALKSRSYSVDSGSKMSKPEWTNVKDKEIAERLHRLKRERIKDELPSEVEIEERLARLKGMDPAKYKAPPIQVFRPADRRTSIEQATDLIKQITEEVDIESHLVKPVDEIAARLARLKNQAPDKEQKESTGVPEMQQQSPVEEMDIEKSATTFKVEHGNISKMASTEVKDLLNDPEYKILLSSFKKEKDIEKEHDSSDEEEEANKLVEKLMATNIDNEIEELESLNGQDEDKSKNEDASAEEFPWCVICTEDAKIRCFGCEEDLYCMHCFKECHDSLDIQDHRTCPFLGPKSALI